MVWGIKNIVPCSDGVVIGSRTLEECKFQVLNFMSMLYNVIVKDSDYSTCGHSNLYPWVNNLCYEIKRLDEVIPHDSCYKFDKLIYHRIFTIETALRTLSLADDDAHVLAVKKCCLRIWRNLLDELTKLYDLKYSTKD